MKAHQQTILKGSGCLLFFLCFALICGLLVSVLTGLFNQLVPLPLAIGLALLLLGGICLFFISPSLLPSAQRRQAVRRTALIGNRSLVPLANPQAVPDEGALPLPLDDQAGA